MKLPDSVCFVDLETSGISSYYSRIIEIGIIKVKNGKVVKKYNQLINPQSRIDPFITNLTGITQEMIERAPIFDEIKTEILEIIKDSIFVAHNVRFDYGFIRQEFKRHDITYTSKHFCTIKVARYLFPSLKRYNLDSIIQNFKIKCQNRHRAFDDAWVLWKFYQYIQKKLPHEVISNAISKAMKRPTVPINISEEVLDSLPETAGVYIFYGDNNMPLYIGKSINLKDRILSHFSSDYLSSTDMRISAQAARIETIETSGELSALLLESSLVKEKQPLFNRRLRHARKMTLLLKSEKDGYLTVKEEELENIQTQDLDRILGVFRSKRQLKDFLYSLAKEYKLCLKLLNLEKTKSVCFNYRLDLCRGACEEKEAAIRYNLRFEEAFYRYKIKPWKFNGPILIKEGGKEAFVVDKWRLLGRVKNKESLSEVSKKYIFDLDTYIILSRYIMSPKNLSKINTTLE
ncbi:MAG: exonuclease domain-containing protein [Candidatus Levybacteria bacterium]|nr:exonuclease domain-containing protein [Candidatus Levybacteria bacterium]